MMNKIEKCAMEYLYHTRDCEFAEMLVNSLNYVNEELIIVARGIINDFLKTPKWMKISHSKCTKNAK